MSNIERVLDNLRKVEIFEGLADEELLRVAGVCRIQRSAAGETIFSEGDDGDELFILQEGFVRVSIKTRNPKGEVAPSTINMLYAGQSFGEMVLLGGATRSASVVSADPCVLLVMKERDFSALCEANPRIGYRVMRNLAADLAYKLRSSNLLLRGNIRLQPSQALPNS